MSASQSNTCQFSFDQIALGIVCPMANEGAAAVTFVSEVLAACKRWSFKSITFFAILDNVSKDNTRELLEAAAREGQRVETAADVIKDPFVLEFLGLTDRPAWKENDLESAIIARLEEFLLEMGKGFCFVARQKRITLEGDHFYIDLVFYNRLLRCFVLLDLKLGKLTHEDLGQMQMYVNYFDRLQRAPHERKTIGIVLCSDKNDAMVKISLPEHNEQIVASRYQMYLPTEEELRAELAREREDAERRVRRAKRPLK